MHLDRSRWSHLADEISVPLSAEEIESLRGLGETVDLEEVQRIYLPVSRLLNLYVTAASSLNHMTNDFLHVSQRRVPFIIVWRVLLPWVSRRRRVFCRLF